MIRGRTIEVDGQTWRWRITRSKGDHECDDPHCSGSAYCYRLIAVRVPRTKAETQEKIVFEGSRWFGEPIAVTPAFVAKVIQHERASTKCVKRPLPLRR